MFLEGAFEVDIMTGEIIKMNIKKSPLLDFKNFNCSRKLVLSHDSYSVPLTIFGSNEIKEKPTLLIGYGSYGVSLNMDYNPDFAVMLSRGWNIVFAHTR